MTLNQIIKRIRLISLAHQQVSNFYYGLPTDFLTDKTTLYPSVFLQDVPGGLDLTGKADTLNFKLFALDLVNVSEDSKSNEVDVLSDMREVVKDLIALMNDSSYSDWKVGISNTVTLVREEFDDLVAGAVIDFSIITPYVQDKCVVPFDGTDEQEIIIPDSARVVFDTEYVASGSEGSVLDIEEIKGKKILLIIREQAPLHKISSNPSSSEYVWDDENIQLGANVSGSGERFLILYRNY